MNPNMPESDAAQTPVDYHDLLRNSRWQEAERVDVPQEWGKWLLDRGSLTTALREFSQGRFKVRVLAERWGRLLPYETQGMGVNGTGRSDWIREVELLCSDAAVVFARSVIPQDLARRESQVFQGMGTQPLGHLLFRQGQPRYEERRLSVYRGEADGRVIYGRTTPHTYAGCTILVSEFFISPALLGNFLC